MKKLSQDSKNIIKKLLFSCAVVLAIIGVGYLVFHLLGWNELSREEIQQFIEGTGALAPLVFILISFAQVTLIPIPGTITILAGSYIFGPILSFVYSYIGMFIGGMVAFLLGRLIGRPYINWVAGGKDKAEKWIKKLKGRETVFLFFAFLLPLFPDDILCAIAGVLPVSWLTFIIMQVITRATSIGGTLIFMSGELIPYHGWGLCVLIALGILLLISFVLAIKYADKLNSTFLRFIDKIFIKHKK